MTDISIGASLAVRPDPRSLRDARDEIEDAVGDVTVDVSGGSGRSGGAGASMLRDQADNQEAMLRLDDERNELLQDILDALDGGAGGAGGGGGGGRSPRRRGGGGLGGGGLGGLLGILGLGLGAAAGAGAASETGGGQSRQSPSLADQLTRDITGLTAGALNAAQNPAEAIRDGNEAVAGALGIDGPLYTGPDPLNARENPGRAAGLVGGGLLAGGLAAADGPLPFGDVAAGAIAGALGLGGLLAGATGSTRAQRAPRGPSPSLVRRRNRQVNTESQQSAQPTETYNITVSPDVTVENRARQELEQRLNEAFSRVKEQVKREITAQITGTAGGGGAPGSTSTGPNDAFSRL